MIDHFDEKPESADRQNGLIACDSGKSYQFSGSKKNRYLQAKHFRTNRAQLIAEVPVVMWVMIILMMIPFIDMVTFTIRYNFLLAASRDAAQAASLSKTFLANTSSTDLSAVNSATAAAQQDVSAFTEVTLTSVTTNIVITNLNTGIVTRQSTPLTLPADTVNNAYQIETILKGTTSPLLQFPSQSNWGAVPGLSAPVPVSISSIAYFENPQGLNQ